MYDDNSSTQLMALANLMNVKDSRWLQLEVCREFQRGQCSRSELECKFSHPPSHVEIQNGRVTACYDSIKGRCTRENPKCKYLHPPQHLKDQLLINGKNNLAVKNLFMNQFTTPAVTAPLAVNPLTMAGSGATFVPNYATAYSPYAAYTINPAAYQNLVTSPDILSSMGSVLQSGALASQASLAAVMAMQAQKAATVANVTSFTTHGTRADKTEVTKSTLVCREFMRGQCPRAESDCKYAHPSSAAPAAVGRQPLASALTASSGLAAIHQAANSALASRNASNLVTNPPNGACGQAPLSNSKKRPLEMENGHLNASAAEQYFLAAAAMNSSASKRAAVDKSGVPFYQPFTHIPAVSLGLQYPQLAAMPTLQTSYFPAFSAAANSALTAPPASTAANAGVFGLTNQQTSHLALPPEFTLAMQNFLAADCSFLSGKPTVNPTNANAVAYFDESGQLLDTLPVCRDFKQSRCDRSSCRYVHLIEDCVEITEGKVTVCRDFVKGKCCRFPCKFYHLPLPTNAPSTPSIQQPAQLLQPSSLVGAAHASQPFVGGVSLQPTNQIQQPLMLFTPTSSINSTLVALQQQQQQLQANQIAAHYLAAQSAAPFTFLANQQCQSSLDNQHRKMALASSLPIDCWSLPTFLTPQQQQLMHLIHKTSSETNGL